MYVIHMNISPQVIWNGRNSPSSLLAVGGSGLYSVRYPEDSPEQDLDPFSLVCTAGLRDCQTAQSSVIMSTLKQLAVHWRVAFASLSMHTGMDALSNYCDNVYVQSGIVVNQMIRLEVFKFDGQIRQVAFNVHIVESSGACQDEPWMCSQSLHPLQIVEGHSKFWMGLCAEISKCPSTRFLLSNKRGLSPHPLRVAPMISE